jgi:hypothetical protein
MANLFGRNFSEYYLAYLRRGIDSKSQKASGGKPGLLAF